VPTIGHTNKHNKFEGCWQFGTKCIRILLTKSNIQLTLRKSENDQIWCGYASICTHCGSRLCWQVWRHKTTVPGADQSHASLVGHVSLALLVSRSHPLHRTTTDRQTDRQTDTGTSPMRLNSLVAHLQVVSKVASTPGQGNMLPGNMLLVAGNVLPVSRQHDCIQQQTGNKLAILLTATSNMFKATCCRATVATCCLMLMLCRCHIIFSPPEKSAPGAIFRPV